MTGVAADVMIEDDATVEPIETVILTMGAPTNATAGTNTTFTASILSEDGNSLPVLAQNSRLMLVNPGDSGTITNSLLQTTDGNNTPAELTYTLGSAPA